MLGLPVRTGLETKDDASVNWPVACILMSMDGPEYPETADQSQDPRLRGQPPRDGGADPDSQETIIDTDFDDQRSLLDGDATLADHRQTRVSDIDPAYGIPTLTAGTQVGKYVIEGILGVGGMGAVYRATQRKPQRRVALKLIRPGVLSTRVIQRFDLEAEILGRLHHPNIGQIYEAGIDAQTGSPYFAMEFVDGQELLDYARDQNLSVEQRLHLFIKLCDAIIHAHAKGIIHRDLKPGNVIVSREGEPKVLDFGIARATDSDHRQMTLQTNVGQLVGTLSYMSPEQAKGDVQNLDTRSDVYALGVVLFELLTDVLPYELDTKPLHEAIRVILDAKPRRLSEFDQSLRGDMDVIAQRVLEKEKERRYQSVAELRADIMRSLENKPILARPPSPLYLTTKFVRRNTRLTLAAACVLLIFVIGGGFAINQWYGRIQARQLALDNMLLSLNEMDVQKGLAPDLSKRLLDLYSDNGELLFSGDPQSLAIFYTNLGEAYFGYEDYVRARSVYEKAYALRAKKLAPPHSLLAQSLHHIANAEFYLGNYEQARKHYLDTLKMYQTMFGPSDPESAETARTMDHLGSTYVKVGQFDEAVQMYNQARAIRVTLFGAGSLEVAMSDNSIAWFHVQRGEYEVAEPIYRRALTTLQGLEEDESKPLWVARAKHSLGNTLISLGQYKEARELLTGALGLKTELLASNKPSVASTLQSLAEVCVALEDYESAEAYASEVISIRQQTADPRLEQSSELLQMIRLERSRAESLAID